MSQKFKVDSNVPQIQDLQFIETHSKAREAESFVTVDGTTIIQATNGYFITGRFGIDLSTANRNGSRPARVPLPILDGIRRLGGITAAQYNDHKLWWTTREKEINRQEELREVKRLANKLGLQLIDPNLEKAVPIKRTRRKT